MKGSTIILSAFALITSSIIANIKNNNFMGTVNGFKVNTGVPLKID
jgi:hypothetical protein